MIVPGKPWIKPKPRKSQYRRCLRCGIEMKGGLSQLYYHMATCGSIVENADSIFQQAYEMDKKKVSNN